MGLQVMRSFAGGVHLLESKYTSQLPIKEMTIPKTVVIPLSQHTGSVSRPVVKVGDFVKTGQLIAEANGFISANLHASVSGRVRVIEPYPHPCGFNFESIIIDSDNKDETAGFKEKDPEKLSPGEIIEIIKNAGIVGLGGAGFPTHVKLLPQKEKKVDSVILNGAECEPFLTADHRVMVEHTERVLKGLKIIMKALNIQNGYIAIEDNKADAIVKFNELVATEKNIKVIKLKTKYPQGAEKMLIKAVLNRDVPSGGLPFDVGCIVQNVQTAMAIYEAVCKGKPLYERVITVTGNVRRPANLRVRIGTLISDIIDFCGGFTREPKKIILGGPMMGITQSSLNVPVVKGTTGLVILAEKDTMSYEPSNCIRCGRCIDVCPMHLVPMMISRMVEMKRYDELKSYNPLDCFECGCCAYICPAKIHLVQNIKLAKTIIQLKKI